MLGCSQVVRHRTLNPVCEGPNPSTPAILFYLNLILNPVLLFVWRNYLMNPSRFYYKIEDTPSANTYEIRYLKNNICFLKVVFDKELEQVIISTPKEVYQGPIDLIQFSTDVTDKALSKKK
jgi:hypothetical protein